MPKPRFVLEPFGFLFLRPARMAVAAETDKLHAAAAEIDVIHHFPL